MEKNGLFSQRIRLRHLHTFVAVAQQGTLGRAAETLNPVSYTHLTLPTNREVYISVIAVSLKKKTKNIYCLKKTKQQKYSADKPH